MMRFYVSCYMQNDNTNNEVKLMRANNYIVNNYSDILKYRALDSMPIDHDIMLKLKEKGMVRKDFGKGFWFVFRLEKLDAATEVNLKRRKIIK